MAETVEMKRCEHPKCEREITLKEFACRLHFFTVPKALRTEWSLARRNFYNGDKVERFAAAINAIKEHWRRRG